MQKNKKQNNLIEKQKELHQSYKNFCSKISKIKSDGFQYSHLSETKPDFCPLFSTKQICHNISKDQLSCRNCYCHYYDIDYLNKKKKLLGRCKIQSVYGKYTNGIWDCSDCLIPHIDEK